MPSRLASAAAMSTASVAVAEKSVPQTIGALWFFFTGYRSFFRSRILNWQQNIVRFVHGRITCGLSTKQIVAISGNLKARRRLENKGTLATNSNVFA